MAVLIFFIGAILGSFYLVVGTRLPKGEDVLFSRSKCDSCGKPLKWYNLIPIFSYVFQSGKCTYCNKKIAGEHIIVEIATGLLFVFTYYYLPAGYYFYVGLIISSLLIIIFVSDFKYMIILDSPLIISGILVIILKLIFYGFKPTLISIASGIALFCVMLLLFQLGKFLFKKEALGGGDIKLAGVIGIVLGLKLGLVSIILSSLLALPYAVGAMLLNKNSEVPFGPFLIASMAIVFVFAEKFSNLIAFLF